MNEQFKEENLDIIKDFVAENSFGTMFSHSAVKMYATPTPFFIEKLIDDGFKLYGHLSLDEEQVNHIQNGEQVLCIFSGPHSYISPGWYAEPNVPTWNYKTVQITGKVKKITGDMVSEVLTKMVDHYEQTTLAPMKVEELPMDLLKEDVANIFVFEIEVTNIEASFSLSQNKDDISYHNIIRELKKQSDFNALLIAFEMEQNIKRRRKAGN
jgi:transcriptional regulator